MNLMMDPERKKSGPIASFMQRVKAEWDALRTGLDTRMLTLTERLGPLAMRGGDPCAFLRYEDERTVELFMGDVERYEAMAQVRSRDEMRGILQRVTYRYREYPPEPEERYSDGVAYLSLLFEVVGENELGSPDQPAMSYQAVAARADEVRSLRDGVSLEDQDDPHVAMALGNAEAVRELFLGVVGGGRF